MPEPTEAPDEVLPQDNAPDSGQNGGSAEGSGSGNLN
jgi:hypothetical protein